MWPENEKDIVDAAAEHIEEASIADGLENEPKPEPITEGVPDIADLDITSEEAIVGAAAEHIADAAVADGRVQ